MSRPASRRTAVLFAAVLGCWALLTGVLPVPLAHHAATSFQGHFVTSTVQLTGARAKALPAAGGTAGRALAVAPDATAPTAATPGWSARLAIPDHAELVAFSWAGKVAGELQVRVSTGSSFQPWTAVDGTPAEGPDGTTGEGSAVKRTSTGTIWVGHDATAVEVRVTSGTLHDLQVETLRWDGTLASPGSGMATASAEPADPGVIPRSAWDQGHGWVKNPGCTAKPIQDPTLKMAIVHHTVQANDYAPNDVPMMILGDYEYHTGPTLQWCDIAYNFLIDKYGRIWQGRSGDTSVAIESGASLGFNTDTVSVALIGQYQPGAANAPAASTVTSAEQLAVAKIIAWKFGLFGINPHGTVSYAPSTDVSPHGVLHKKGVPFTLPTIVGHQDTSSTDCPGVNAEKLLPAIRNQVAFLLTAAATPARWKPFASAQALMLQQYSDVLLRAGTPSEAAYWINQMVTSGMTVDTVITRMLTSTEVTNSQPPLYRLYVGELGRVPDLAGFRFWAHAISAGAYTLTHVATSFANSPEFVATYGNTTNTQFVQLLYQHVLGRTGDTAGVTYWTQQLDAGHSRGTVTVNFTESPENQARTGTASTVQIVYLDLLQRPADAAGLQYWSTQVDAGMSLRKLVSSIYGSAEYRSRVS